MPGTLYVVATPIGNLADLTPRAREVLASVALIAAEDTRHTRQLLQSCGIGTRADVAARTQRSAQERGARCKTCTRRVDRTGQRRRHAVGERSRLRSGRGCAQAKASQSSRFPARVRRSPRCRSRACRPHRFAFEGFLPAKTAARSERLERLAREERTLIFYEAPHRLAEVAARHGADIRRGTSCLDQPRADETLRNDIQRNACRAERSSGARQRHDARRNRDRRERRAADERSTRDRQLKSCCARCWRSCRRRRPRRSPRTSPARKRSELYDGARRAEKRVKLSSAASPTDMMLRC